MKPGTPWWVWPLGTFSVFCLTPMLGLAFVQSRPAPKGSEIVEAYRVLASEGAGSSKLAAWYSEAGIATLKVSEREFGRPEKMFRPSPSHFVGGGFVEPLLVKRGGRWTDETTVLVFSLWSPVRKMQTGRARAAEANRKAAFEGHEVVELGRQR